jgi:hypothetical protein
MKLLTIKAASDICSAEIKHLEAIAEMFGITHCSMEISDADSCFKQSCWKDKFDFVYLGAHANTEFFGESDGSIEIPWSDLGAAFCQHDCLTPGAIVLLGCCRGGLKRVALHLMCACDKVDYVCGPRWTVSPMDIAVGFHVFLYNIVHRREQPSTAVQRASKATNYDFFCHDRVELQDELDELCPEQECCPEDDPLYYNARRR